jgi:hypothetical protein
MAEHRQEFQRELEGIEGKVIELFAMVAEDLPVATDALLTGNRCGQPRLAGPAEVAGPPVRDHQATLIPGRDPLKKC